MNSTALTEHAAAQLSDQFEALAFADLYAAAPSILQAELELRIQQVADATLCIAAKVPSPMFNRVIGLGLSQPATLDTVAQISEEFNRSKCSNWWLHWNPHAHPSDTPDQLQKLGFTLPPRRAWAKMLHDNSLVPLADSDLRIDVANDDQINDVTAAITQAFEMPPFMAQWLQALHNRPNWRIYAVMDQDQVVGGGCQFFGGAASWIGMGGILSTHRNRGGQRNLMAFRINDAIHSGCLHIATETGEAMADEPNPSLRNMERCGFVKVASRRNFAAPLTN